MGNSHDSPSEENNELKIILSLRVRDCTTSFVAESKRSKIHFFKHVIFNKRGCSPKYKTLLRSSLSNLATSSESIEW